MNAISNSGYSEKLRERLEQIAMTLEHLRNERRGVEDNTKWMDRTAYQKRMKLLDRLTGWYYEETVQIENALDRSRSSRYGLCLACHEPIEAERLEICPETEFCIECENFANG